MKHIPVLLDKVLETLGDIRGKTILDCTFGAGGYSRAMLERGANVIAFDRDPSVIPDANKLGEQFPDSFKFLLLPFSEIKNSICVRADAIVFDFGISSMQIDTPERGFSFRFDAPLDMRMGDGISAADLIREKSEPELVKILREYGDVKKAVPIARAIKEKSPQTTFELRDLIYDPRDVANVFQALRIAVNDELGEIERALDAVPEMLNPGGMCICVTFHSLEDRIVKNYFREWTTPIGDPRLAGLGAGDWGLPKFKKLKTYRPDDIELENNPRARSAHLRAVIKVTSNQ